MSNKYRVSATELNFRSSPKVEAGNIIAPLPQGQIVQKIEEVNNSVWWKISTLILGDEKIGFVSSDFLISVGVGLKEVIEDNLTLQLTELKNNKNLVIEIQQKLRNLGLYPGGPWIDGKLGSNTSRTSQALNIFCQELGLTSPTSDNAMNATISDALLKTKQLESILNQAKDSASILSKLKSIQTSSPVQSGDLGAYLHRDLNNSPFESLISIYPEYLAQEPDGINLVSYGKTFTLQGSGKTVTFDDYPKRGQRPSIDGSGLDFLNSGISRACVCVGSFVPGDDEIKAHWLGRDSLVESQYLSSTKFIGVLNTISKLNTASPSTDIDECKIGSLNGKRFDFYSLVEDMVTYKGKIISNRIGAMFKRFSTRAELEKWIWDLTGNPQVKFRGYYGTSSFISSPRIFDTQASGNQTVLRSAPEIGSGPNSISSYDLVRLITMLGWHLHLPSSAKIPGAQWHSLESLIRAMGHDRARYVDVAVETLGLVNVIDKPVVFSKVGWGDSAVTYVALVKFVDQRQTPAKLRTVAMALWADKGGYRTRDNNLAAGVTEIMRRIFTEELA